MDATGNTIGADRGLHMATTSTANTGNGVEITGASATGNLVQGNVIDSNLDGVKIADAPGNTIGGTVTGGAYEFTGNEICWKQRERCRDHRRLWPRATWCIG